MKSTRTATVHRKTRETDIYVSVNLDGNGTAEIETGIGFFDHMLDALSRHSGIDLVVKAKGDLEIDCHHTVEDVGIVLGMALKKALADKKSIIRFGFAYCPLDEALARSVIDISGRAYFIYNCDIEFSLIGQFPGELWQEFLRAFTTHAALNLHVHLIYGTNQHHIIEAMAKAIALALKQAIRINPGQSEVPSTKGVLE
ncbi:imidazoleglycerol-phosphate dehydratase HisB [candidate division KSB1 bacterium]|nr:imidazoleglycerol-phosphate dehydratase HisB [candidate division KSB1 bacterium]